MIVDHIMLSTVCGTCVKASSKYSVTFDKNIIHILRYFAHFTVLNNPQTKVRIFNSIQIHTTSVVLRVFLWGVQVWGLLRLVRGSQMVFVCDGEQQRYSGGSFHRSGLISLFHLQALCSYKHPQYMALWCFCHCVYSEKSGKYMNFKTKRTRMNNGMSAWAFEFVV